ncbi:MAG: phosphoglycerate mutase (PgaM) [Candidatus Magnetoglobus multicellularis str. Araruama]|uniref:Phosphoglycerate mutase (PgaM) n=1 Tax=Candidatus Magnetoglobus multicellularis str. Araruama TaxID=890399 RepID=A0A1V1PCL7_9BACT|nr:MAG: phosphoglycerate mutase (PgaM) [Candidatus Magnetoglobus multicellularis str. Araruama]
MGKIILIRHGKAGFGQDDYDQLSEMGKYQATITGQYIKQAKIEPTAIYSGSLKRQQETAEFAIEQAGLLSEIIVDPKYNEYDHQGIINCCLPDLLKDNPSMAKEVDKAFDDYPTFEHIFSKLLERWISNKFDSSELETFASYTNRVSKGLDMISKRQDKEDLAIVFTSGGWIAMSMHYILNIPPVTALKLGWTIYNCSMTSFHSTQNEYRLETFNTVTHLEMDGRDGIITII